MGLLWFLMTYVYPSGDILYIHISQSGVLSISEAREKSLASNVDEAIPINAVLVPLPECLRLCLPTSLEIDSSKRDCRQDVLSLACLKSIARGWVNENAKT